VISHFREDRTPAEELTLEIEEAAQAGLRVALHRAVDLRGVGPPSRVLVLRSQWLRAGRSDEIRIYDEGDDDLRLRLRFRPAYDLARENLSAFELMAIRDIDANGTAEIIGSFSQIAMATPFVRRPVLIRWDPRSRDYEIGAILGPPKPRDPPSDPSIGLPEHPLKAFPGLARLYERGDYADLTQRRYLKAFRLRDPRTAVAFESYAVEDFFVTTGRLGGTVLVAGFTVKARGHVDNPEVLQVRAWNLDTDPYAATPGEIIAAYECVPQVAPGRELDPNAARVLIRHRGLETIRAMILRGWIQMRARLYC
jgi:hypothetical protein